LRRGLSGRTLLLICGLPCLVHAISALFQCIAHDVAGAIIGADLIKESLVRNLAFRYGIAAGLKLLHNFRFGFGKKVRIFLQDLNDVVSREILVLLWLLLRLGKRQHGEESKREGHSQSSWARRVRQSCSRAA
jgi:hypothetical protein